MNTYTYNADLVRRDSHFDYTHQYDLSGNYNINIDTAFVKLSKPIVIGNTLYIMQEHYAINGDGIDSVVIHKIKCIA